jgi:hypothetical protein
MAGSAKPSRMMTRTIYHKPQRVKSRLYRCSPANAHGLPRLPNSGVIGLPLTPLEILLTSSKGEEDGDAWCGRLERA